LTDVSSGARSRRKRLTNGAFGFIQVASLLSPLGPAQRQVQPTGSSFGFLNSSRRLK